MNIIKQLDGFEQRIPSHFQFTIKMKILRLGHKTPHREFSPKTLLVGVHNEKMLFTHPHESIAPKFFFHSSIPKIMFLMEV